jgi:hypothetical protein
MKFLRPVCWDRAALKRKGQAIGSETKEKNSWESTAKGHVMERGCGCPLIQQQPGAGRDIDESAERNFGHDTTESVIIGNQLGTCL